MWLPWQRYICRSKYGCFCLSPKVTYLHTKIEGGLKIFISNFASLSWRIALNFKIVVAVRRHANQIQALQVQPTAQNSGANMRDAAAWRKFAIGTLLVYLAFLVCYLPNFCFLIVYLISDPLSSNTVVLDLFSSTVLFLNSTLNPLIYCWKMRRIRLTILTILGNMLQRLTQN